MIGLNVSKGSAPEIRRPLMKNAGVPSAPTCVPYRPSLVIAFASSVESLSRRHRFISSPICFAHSSYLGSDSSVWCSNISLCISQNFPCLCAAIAAFAAGSAFGWKGSGSLRHTSFTSPLYVSRIFRTVGSTRRQNGHWKSENSTIVTFAFFAPVHGESAPISTRRACAGGGACGGGAGGADAPSFTSDS